MVSLKEISWSLFGIYRIIRRDRFALDYFNISTGGFYNSFGALLIALPFFALENAIDYRHLSDTISMPSFLILLCLALLTSWALFLLAIAVLARFFGYSDKFSVFVIVYNWMQLALIVLWLPISILIGGLLPYELVNLANLLFIGASYVLLWQIFRITLQFSGGMAAGFAFMEFLIAVLIQNIFSSWLFTASGT